MSLDLVSQQQQQQLAIEGGPRVRSEENKFPPWPFFSPEQITAASQVLSSGKVNYWTGEQCKKFEEEYGKHLGRKHVVSLANGTLALEAAMMSYEIKVGDEVIVTPRSFVISASCPLLRGATPVFVDVDEDSGNLTPQTIVGAITPQTRAIIVVHLSGFPADVANIMKLVKDKNIVVIEDCAQAHGARYLNLEGEDCPVGSLAHAAVFSFCQDKIISTAGEGGLFVTNDEDVWKKVWSFKDHGKDFDIYHPTSSSSSSSSSSSLHHNFTTPSVVLVPGYRYTHVGLGTNWRLTEFQAAVGRVALGGLESQVLLRRRNAKFLNNRFSKLCALRLPLIDDNFSDLNITSSSSSSSDSPTSSVRHSYYKYYCFVRPERLAEGWDRGRILRSILAEGVPCFSGAGELYLETVFTTENSVLHPSLSSTSSSSSEPRFLPVTRRLAETSLLFLVHPTLTLFEMEDTCRAVEKVFAQATLKSEI